VYLRGHADFDVERLLAIYRSWTLGGQRSLRGKACRPRSCLPAVTLREVGSPVTSAKFDFYNFCASSVVEFDPVSHVRTQ
jgi:hypothetical protein